MILTDIFIVWSGELKPFSAFWAGFLKGWDSGKCHANPSFNKLAWFVK
jgi:hypothetical protein